MENRNMGCSVALFILVVGFAFGLTVASVAAYFGVFTACNLG